MKRMFKKLGLSVFVLLGVLFMSKSTICYAMTDEEKAAYQRETEIINTQTISPKEMKVQLESEGFSKGTARYIVNSYIQDWENEAMDYMDKCIKELDENWTRTSLYKKLTDEEFSSDEAKYAMSYCYLDWMESAVVFAEEYAKSGNYSKPYVKEALEQNKFTDEETEYAIKNFKADFNKNALGKAKELIKLEPYSKTRMQSALLSNGFSKSETTYALKNMKANWKLQAVRAAKLLKSKKYDYTKKMAETWLNVEYGFTKSEIAYAIKKVYKE